MSMIRVDYDNARRQAQKLQDAADDCDLAIRKLRLGTGQLSDFWEGASAETFTAAVQVQIAEIQKIKSSLESTALHIRKVADELERKEKELAAATQSAGTSTVIVDGTQPSGGRSGGAF